MGGVKRESNPWPPAGLRAQQNWLFANQFTAWHRVKFACSFVCADRTVLTHRRVRMTDDGAGWRLAAAGRRLADDSSHELLV